MPTRNHHLPTLRASQTFYHPLALVESPSVGRGTRIWAYAHVLPGAVIGQDCNICDHTFIENDVVLGDRVTVKCGVQLWDGITIENDVFIGPNATFTNDPFPRSKQHLPAYPRTIIRQGASIGANATILPGVVVGRNAMIGAGTVVTDNVPAHAIVVGNPGRISGYVGPDSLRMQGHAPTEPGAARRPLTVPSARLVELPSALDLRGNVTFGEYPSHLPFLPRRVFFIYGVPTKEVRGENAHRRLHQCFICLHGSCRIMVDDGHSRDLVDLNRPGLGLYVEPMTWVSQYHFSADAVLLCLASDVYAPEDYIRDYDEFLQAASRKNGKLQSTS